jgi:hypothetical protein
MKSYALFFVEKNRLGDILGDFFQPIVWPPCPPTAIEFLMPYLLSKKTKKSLFRRFVVHIVEFKFAETKNADRQNVGDTDCT